MRNFFYVQKLQPGLGSQHARPRHHPTCLQGGLKPNFTHFCHLFPTKVGLEPELGGRTRCQKIGVYHRPPTTLKNRVKKDPPVPRYSRVNLIPLFAVVVIIKALSSMSTLRSKSKSVDLKLNFRVDS